jgi:histidine triad (HIT) family protein
MISCVFCAIVQDEPNKLILQNDHAAVILSDPRLVKGHSLVIPKRHVEYPGDMEASELADIFALIEKVRASLLQSELAEGVDVRQHYRPWLPESRLKVDHIHFHLLPRQADDQLYQVSLRHEVTLFDELSVDERQEVSGILTSDNT